MFDSIPKQNNRGENVLGLTTQRKGESRHNCTAELSFYFNPSGLTEG